MREIVESTMFMHVSDCSKAHKFVRKDSQMLKLVINYFKTQEICEKLLNNCF